MKNKNIYAHHIFFLIFEHNLSLYNPIISISFLIRFDVNQPIICNIKGAVCFTNKHGHRYYYSRKTCIQNTDQTSLYQYFLISLYLKD